MPVMPVPGLDPGIVAGIHVFLSEGKKDVDGRNKSGHDVVRASLEGVAIGDAVYFLLHGAGVVSM